MILQKKEVRFLYRFFELAKKDRSMMYYLEEYNMVTAFNKLARKIEKDTMKKNRKKEKNEK